MEMRTAVDQLRSDYMIPMKQLVVWAAASRLALDDQGSDVTSHPSFDQICEDIWNELREAKSANKAREAHESVLQEAAYALECHSIPESGIYRFDRNGVLPFELEASLRRVALADALESFDRQVYYLGCREPSRPTTILKHIQDSMPDIEAKIREGLPIEYTNASQQIVLTVAPDGAMDFEIAPHLEGRPQADSFIMEAHGSDAFLDAVEQVSPAVMRYREALMPVHAGPEEPAQRRDAPGIGSRPTSQLSLGF